MEDGSIWLIQMVLGFQLFFPKSAIGVLELENPVA
jgi:hypothetical protein